MGFWDQINDVMADYERPFVSKDEKAELLRTGEPFEVVGARRVKTKRGEGRFYLDVNIPSFGPRTLSFNDPSFKRRQVVLEKLVEHFSANGSEAIDAKLAMWGPQAIGLEPAE